MAEKGERRVVMKSIKTYISNYLSVNAFTDPFTIKSLYNFLGENQDIFKKLI